MNVRGTLGGVSVAPATMAGWNVAREIAVVPIDPNAANSEFMSYYVATSSSQSWLMGKRKGAAYVGINIEDIRRLPVQLPAKKAQAAVARSLSEEQQLTDALKDNYERKLQALMTLKTSLLTQAFAGELTA